MSESQRATTEQPSVQFHMIKSNHFRVIHGDGVWGGVTPQGNISVGIFSERGTIPQVVEYKVDPSGGLGEEADRQTKGGYVREIEVEIVMNRATTISVIKWLKDRIEDIDRITQERERVAK